MAENNLTYCFDCDNITTTLMSLTDGYVGAFTLFEQVIRSVKSNDLAISEEDKSNLSYMIQFIQNDLISLNRFLLEAKQCLATKEG